MAQTVSVRLKRAGKRYSFRSPGLELRDGEKVVIETERGADVGIVVGPPREVSEEEAQSLKPVLRLATPEDLEGVRRLAEQAREAMDKAREQVARLGLPMKFLGAEYSLDSSRLTFYFSAPGRVDFRELIRELASIFRTRIEMRQVGPRDETGLMGGIGHCGLPLCCSRWLSEFSPVSIRMAKEQEIALNPNKISGVCGKLLCCLAYEVEYYIKLREKLPQKGLQVTTPHGAARVVGGNAIKETVTVELESGAVVEVPLAQVTPQVSGAGT